MGKAADLFQREVEVGQHSGERLRRREASPRAQGRGPAVGCRIKGDIIGNAVAIEIAQTMRSLDRIGHSREEGSDALLAIRCADRRPEMALIIDRHQMDSERAAGPGSWMKALEN